MKHVKTEPYISDNRILHESDEGHDQWLAMSAQEGNYKQEATEEDLIHPAQVKGEAEEEDSMQDPGMGENETMEEEEEEEEEEGVGGGGWESGLDEPCNINNVSTRAPARAPEEEEWEELPDIDMREEGEGGKLAKLRPVEKEEGLAKLVAVETEKKEEKEEAPEYTRENPRRSKRKRKQPERLIDVIHLM